MNQSILIVDDEALARSTSKRVLVRCGYRVLEAESGEEALELLGKELPDLILSDLQMPGMDGLELLSVVRTEYPSLPTVVLSGAGSIEAAVKSVQMGAVDFLEKPCSPERLEITIANALRISQLEETNARLTEERRAVQQLLGDSPAMKKLREIVMRVGATDGRVLVLGENGSGKELVAAALHECSPRRDQPFVKLNCAAIPEGLVESELFGHERGAFTGATAARKGRFELADKGTLFLDEVGELSAAMQAKLLRVLQEGRFERVGGSHTFNVDVRVVSATNRDLEAMIDEGQFREDLYYRLNVVTLHVPPLRERLSDVKLLAEAFLEAARARHGRPRLAFVDGALDVLVDHDYRGNVRELQNIIERLVIMSDSDRLGPEGVRAALPRRRGTRAASRPSGVYRPNTPLRELLLEVEKSILRASIEANGGNKTEAARELDLERSHFYKKVKQLLD